MAKGKSHSLRVTLSKPEVRFNFRHPSWMLAGGVILAVIWIFTLMRPVMDTDLWFQMAYARQMLESRTLIPDHTAFSWTPTNGSQIYCAWLMEFFLYGLYSLGGLPLLSVFLYLVFGVFLLLLLLHARSLGVERHPLTWFVALLALLVFSLSPIVKPNIASFLLMSSMVWTWLRIKRGDEGAWRWCYLLPLLMVIWVNSHGGFVVGLGFLGILFFGELLNVRFSRELALPGSVMKHLLIALVLTGAAVLVNPYGWNYPIQLLTLAPATAAISAVREYDSIFAPNQRDKPYIGYAAIGLTLLVALLIPAVRRRRIDWALVLVNLVFVVLYAAYIRMAIFWVPIIVLTSLTLIGQSPGWLVPQSALAARIFGVAILLTGAALGTHSVWSTLTKPNMGTWLGFGNGYWNPEEEVAYIGEHFRDARIGNDYTSGAYLLWKLGPRTKVFIDARAFPYTEWFPEYLKLETTEGIADLLKKYPCDVWLVQHTFAKTNAWFKTSPDWVPAFYGASAAIYVKKGTPLPGGRLQSGRNIDDIRNIYQAVFVLSFALDAHDIAGAERLVAGMKRRFGFSEPQRILVAQSGAVLDGVKAYWDRDYATAVKNLTAAVGTFHGAYQVMLVESALRLMDRAWHDNDPRRALEMAYYAEKYAPNDPVPRYNAGVIKWWLRGDVTAAGSPTGATTWRQDLEAFFKLLPNNRGVNPRAVEIAQAILQGKAEGRPMLMVQPERKMPAQPR